MVACGHTHFAIQAEVVRSVIRPERGMRRRIVDGGYYVFADAFVGAFRVDGIVSFAGLGILVCGMQGRISRFASTASWGFMTSMRAKIKPIAAFHWSGAALDRRHVFVSTDGRARLHTRWLLSHDEAAGPSSPGPRVRRPAEQNLNRPAAGDGHYGCGRDSPGLDHDGI